jgi:CRISPR-associated endonuclease Csn1
MKKILGLDLGTNSIGWAVVNSQTTDDGKEILTGIDSCGSRIIPMDAAVLGDFDKGNSKSQTAERRGYRSVRRIRERELLRRERINRALDILGFLPEHYSIALDRYGKFASREEECKLAWCKDETGQYTFLFKSSFDEMIADLAKSQPMLVADGKKVPYDWTIYYLRKKALTQKIEREELAWILLNFNQKRGYYQLRGMDEDEEDSDKKAKTRQYFDRQVITKVTDTGTLYKGLKILVVELADGSKGKVFRRDIPEWAGQEKDIIVTVDLDKDGNDRHEDDGSLSCRYNIPTDAEWDTKWALVKAKTQQDLDNQHKTVGAYIYDTLLQRPDQKITGKLVRVIERHYYKDELIQILESQLRFHDELRDKEMYAKCIEALYASNEAYRNSIATRDFVYLFVDDIIFYQRPLKSKKSLIDNCPYEENKYTDKDGVEHTVPLKCIAKSHPLFQEFRLWQFLSNLKIYQKERRNAATNRIETDVDVTQQLLPDRESYVALFEWLNDKKEITMDGLLKYPPFGLKKDVANYRWNYVDDSSKKYPCNETGAQIAAFLSKAGIAPSFIKEDGNEESLWHILYSIEDKQELTKALTSFAGKHNLGEDFVTVFKKFPAFKKEYGAYSSKAIKKLLSVMRMGSHWSEQAISADLLSRINKIIDGEADESIDIKTRERVASLTSVSDFSGLPVWLACYVVYGRHSEAKETQQWKTPDDMNEFIKSFRQGSLRNPIVEQVVTESLRTVRDIWRQVGAIDEIHVELGREMKNPADKRRKMTQQILDNENTNLRIKALLLEFMNPEFDIDDVRPYSPSQQDILRIYEDGALNGTEEVPDDIKEIIAKFNQADIKKRPTHAEVMRYKLWLEQKYCSPYTGATISLSKLFTSAYEIEHVIPQSRYFDDSLSNKVICESEVNKLKSNDLGYEFIKKHHGEIVTLSGGRTVKIFNEAEYEKFVSDNYSRNRAKKEKLLLEDIPEKFIERQMNDSRYISKVVKGLLSNIVREDNEPEATSKNLIVCTGGVTDRLKKDWGINDVWNSIIMPRFERLNDMEGSTRFTAVNGNGKLVPAMPLELQKGFNKKRIDHRHHAMDAIVIACAGRNIVNYLNNASASKNATTSRHDLQAILCTKTKTDDNGNYRWIMNKPWDSFTQDVKFALSNIVVSFKQNLRVINKTTNVYQHFDENGHKVMSKQTKGDAWAIRKPMHKETVFGEVNLRRTKTVSLNEAIKNPTRIVDKTLRERIEKLLKSKFSAARIKAYFEERKGEWGEQNLSKINVYYFTKETKDRFFAVRKSIDTTFDEKKINESITDTGIQKIMLNHLKANGGKADIAFSPDGIEEMNRNIVSLNDGVAHKPIYKVRVYEQANKFAVGETGNKRSKFVEGAKGTNLFYAIYESKSTDSETGQIVTKRSYATISLNVVIERQKQGLPSAPENEDGIAPRFVLSPNDLVYLPTAEEIECGHISLPINTDRIYKMVSSGKAQCFFVKYEAASSIVDKFEFSSMNKMERAITGEMIKETCVPISIDRLGNIKIKEEL